MFAFVLTMATSRTADSSAFLILIGTICVLHVATESVVATILNTVGRLVGLVCDSLCKPHISWTLENREQRTTRTQNRELQRAVILSCEVLELMYLLC